MYAGGPCHHTMHAPGWTPAKLIPITPKTTFSSTLPTSSVNVQSPRALPLRQSGHSQQPRGRHVGARRLWDQSCRIPAVFQHMENQQQHSIVSQHVRPSASCHRTPRLQASQVIPGMHSTQTSLELSAQSHPVSTPAASRRELRKSG